MHTLQIVFQMQPGDLYIVNNYRVLHGREPFTLNGGERKLMVINYISLVHKILVDTVYLLDYMGNILMSTTTVHYT